MLTRTKQLELPSRGIYYLLKRGSTDIKKLYVGQTMKGIQRLNDHNAKKKWWDVAVLFLSDDAHTFTLDVITGLEKHAIEQAINALGSIVENKIDPKYVIQAHDRPTVDSLYSEIEFMMGSFGYRLSASTRDDSTHQAIENKTKPTPAQTQLAIDEIAVSMTRRGITVAGIYSGSANGTLKLLSGASIDMTAKIDLRDKRTPELRQQLASQGKLKLQSSGLATLLEDITFTSPTAAAQFVFGGSINGRINWKSADGKSLKELFG